MKPRNTLKARKGSNMLSVALLALLICLILPTLALSGSGASDYAWREGQFVLTDLGIAFSVPEGAAVWADGELAAINGDLSNSPSDPVFILHIEAPEQGITFVVGVREYADGEDFVSYTVAYAEMLAAQGGNPDEMEITESEFAGHSSVRVAYIVENTAVFSYLIPRKTTGAYVIMGSAPITSYDDGSVTAFVSEVLAPRAAASEPTIADYARMIELNPNDAKNYFARGRAYAARWETEAAIADYTRAIELNPNEASYYFYRGDLYCSMEEYDRGLADLTTAIGLDPNDARALFGRGSCYQMLKKYDEAIADYEKVLELDPAMAKSVDFSMNEIRSELGLPPIDAAYLYSRGVASYDLGKYDEAIDYLTRAVELDPTNAAYAEALALAPRNAYASAPQGSAKFLEGRSLLISIFLSNEDSAWNDQAIGKAAAKLAASVAFIEAEGERYGKEVDLVYDFSANPDLVYHMNFGGKIYDYAIADTDEMLLAQRNTITAVDDFIETNIPYLDLCRKYETFSVGFIVYMNYPSIDYNASFIEGSPGSSFIDRSYIFSIGTPGTLSHEILHMFGAADYFYAKEHFGVTDEVVEYVQRNFPNDIMAVEAEIDTESLMLVDRVPYEVSRVTAYCLGWLDDIPELEQFPTLKRMIPAAPNKMN